MTKPDNLVHSDFMHNLGTDHLAVAANGHVIGRAGSAEAIRRAVPDAAHYLTAKDLNKEEIKDEVGKEYGAAINANHAKIVAAIEPNPVSAGLDAVKAQGVPTPGSLVPDADVKADKDLDAKIAAAKTHPQPTAKAQPDKVPTAKTPEHKHTTGKK